MDVTKTIEWNELIPDDIELAIKIRAEKITERDIASKMLMLLRDRRDNLENDTRAVEIYQDLYNQLDTSISHFLKIHEQLNVAIKMLDEFLNFIDAQDLFYPQ